MGCANLTNVSLNEGLTTIDEGTFSQTKIQSITIPSSVTKIEKSAFLNCSALENVVLNEGLTSIGQAAFAKSAINTITIPSTVTEINKSAFALCKKLTSIKSKVKQADIKWIWAELGVDETIVVYE